MKLQDFKDTYEWQLKDYSQQSHKIVLTIPLERYYELGVHCITNRISIAEFIRASVLNKLDYNKQECFKRGELF